MKVKLFILLLVASNCYSSCGAALRRTPKVYNALITTDDNLTSSRAYPVIQPTIHESGIAHYPFGPYNPYGLYNPLVRFGQPIAPGLVQRQPLPYPLPSAQFPPQFLPQPPPSAPAQVPPEEPSPPPTAPGVEQPPSIPPTPSTPTAPGAAQPMSNEKLPIPLNELGLPPALIPLPQYAAPPSPPSGSGGKPGGGPFRLPPYGFNQYPPIFYDPITGYREQYLPPFDYFPPNTFAVSKPRPQIAPLTPVPPPPSPESSPPAGPPVAPPPPPSADDPTEIETEPSAVSNPSPPPPPDAPASFENIKNGSKSKDSDVPDVPPPPIPSGAKNPQ